MSIKIALNVELDDEFVSDVLITAFDGAYGACWGWCSYTGMTAAEEDGEQWTSVSIRYEDDNGGAMVDAVVDAEVVRRGLQAALDGGVAGSTLSDTQSAVREQDAGFADAAVADAVVQLGLFGEVVY